jgi:hypothetical protein
MLPLSGTSLSDDDLEHNAASNVFLGLDDKAIEAKVSELVKSSI